MAEILCEGCRNYKRTYDPQISKVSGRSLPGH